MSQGAIFATIFTVIIIIGGIVIRKNKFYFVLQVIWTLLLICGNTYSDDFVGNSNLYYSSNFIDIHREGFFMSGYYYLSALFNNLGFSYIQFNALFATLSTLIIVGIILKLSQNPCLTFSMFMFYPLTSSIIQKRYYIAMGLLVLGVYILLLDINKVVKSFLYIFVISLACQIHTASIFFFTLIVYFWIPDKIKKYVSIIGLIVMTMCKSQLASLLESSDNTSLSGKSSFYFVTLASNNVFHYIFWIGWHLLFVSLIFYLLKKETVRTTLGVNFSHFLWIINWWSLLIIPLYSFDPVFTRLFRVVIIFNYIAISNLFIIKDRKINLLYFNSGIYQILLSLSSYVIFNSLAVGLPLMGVLIQVFENNMFF